ncbi:MAG: hypothetical protein QXS20_06300 [Candidatus Thorarchaeota archaeon]
MSIMDTGAHSGRRSLRAPAPDEILGCSLYLILLTVFAALVFGFQSDEPYRELMWVTGLGFASLYCLILSMRGILRARRLDQPTSS